MGVINGLGIRTCFCLWALVLPAWARAEKAQGLTSESVTLTVLYGVGAVASPRCYIHISVHCRVKLSQELGVSHCSKTYPTGATSADQRMPA